MKFIYSILFLFLLFGCQSNLEQSLIDKLEGKWVEQDGNREFCETWKKINDSLAEGTGIMMRNGDTLFSERINIVGKNRSVYYIPSVSDQNNGQAIKFKLSSFSNQKWIFENPKHDFPKKIEYLFKHKDSLIITVQGNEEGKIRKIKFNMLRKS